MKQIPNANKIKDPSIRKVLAATVEAVELLGGARGPIEDRALRVSDLVNLGLIRVNGSGKTAILYNPNPESSPSIQDDTTRSSYISPTDHDEEYVERTTLDATSGLTIDTHNLSLTLPDNAIVTRCWYEVQTTFKSATDAATISLGIATDDVAGLVAAIAISHVSNPWDAGYHDGIQDGTAANFSQKTTDSRTIDAVVNGEALTDGLAEIFIEYIVSS